MNKKKLFLIACFSGVLLSLGFPTFGFAPIMLFALVPLLWVEDYISKDSTTHYSPFAGLYYSYVPFLIWNVTTTYWVLFSTPMAIFAFTFNALFMSIAFQCFHFAKRFLLSKTKTRGTNLLSFFILSAFFICFEYLHMDWDLSWPWLTLGNSFCTYPFLIQWYEYTGVFGGSLWIFASNFALLSLVQAIINKEKRDIVTQSSISFLVLALPIAISAILWFNYTDEPNKKVHVVVVQPNLDPYGEEFELEPYQVVDLITRLARTKITTNTSFVLTPESCLQDRAWEDLLTQCQSVNILQGFLAAYPKANWITGMSSRRLLPLGVQTESSKPLKTMPPYQYDNCNIALCLQGGADTAFQISHKSKLTPGVENMPFKKYLKFIDKLAIDLGGTVGSLGKDSTQHVFVNHKTGLVSGTLICYESIYGEFATKFVQKGAQLLFIITNDGWWSDSPGHRQHAAFAALRAIENRRYIARSANTGTSLFVTPKGEEYSKTAYWSQAAIASELVPQKRLTFYTRYGDYIGRACELAAAILLIGTFFFKIRKRIESKSNKSKSENSKTK
jgi:apolipoprotein N-acyltransferase